jgi:hypothetical protein
MNKLQDLQVQKPRVSTLRAMFDIRILVNFGFRARVNLLLALQFRLLYGESLVDQL